MITGLKVDGGEGTRGGRVVGHTSTGKPIYHRHDHPDHASFTVAEHREAAEKHQTRIEHSGVDGPAHAASARWHLKQVENKTDLKEA